MNNDSDTSADLNMNILDNTGEKIHINNKDNNPKKPDSSDTDYYLNLLANQNKLNDKTEVRSDTSLSEIIDDSDSDSGVQSSSESSTRSSSNTSHANIHKVSFSPKNSPRNSPRNSPKNSPTGGSKTSHRNGSKNNDDNPSFIPPPMVEKKELTPQEARMKKIELLRKLSELKTKGYDLSKSYDFNSSIEEMEYEFELLKSFANKRNGVKLYKNILLNTASAVEFLNDKYDPFDFQLVGWSEHMSVEVDSYDEVIEEIYEKYKGSGKKMAPELKLFMLIIASASAFHFSKSTFKNLPGVDKILQNNPDLIAKMMNPQKESSQFMTEQEISLEKQKQAILDREKERRQTTRAPVNNTTNFKNNNFAPINAKQTINTPSESQNPGIKAPMNVQDILNRLHKSENNSNSSETQEETSSNNDRIISKNSPINSSVNSSDRVKGRKKKNIMSIN
jgi:hypothetical protein|uniref:Uncharacterized protein n=1 Tax=viral metagenome TaxID=1070528 RepID=A0A6C0IVG8_9ZZZZ